MEERVGGAYLGPHADEAVYAAVVHLFGHLRVQFGGWQARLEHVGEDEHLALVLHLGPAVKEVEGYLQRRGVGVVGVVDEGAVAHALYHLEPHGHRLEPGHTGRDVGGRKAHVEQHGQAVDAVGG